MRAFFGDRFVLLLPAGHQFLMQKYYLLREGASPNATLLYSVPPPRRDLPVAITMAGGYGRDIKVTVDIHLQTIQFAAAAYGARRCAKVPGTHFSAKFI
jgi:hypothetical protein